ncbi:hypothetical protein HG536_0F04760 [Torulaspora globosa]|uniref:Ty3 transposon capsid-like protein domain-containing protein n=1 Tax=Torulaspora globosa TaxID=48254 RepID=A0A7G3ZKW3_9SACH|nr:uncharacterized protein HG536_0F04760 [Torulaspora globosa]QLL34149.1 hypothetical protein HG536_0F04760 [Torulaspora globosa]
MVVERVGHTNADEVQVDSTLTQLRYCKQRGSLEAYNKEYNALSAAIPDELLSPKCKQSFYLSGLEKSLQITVRNLRPDSLETAMILASNSCGEDRSAECATNTHRATDTDRRKDHLADGDDLDTQKEIDAIRTGYKRRRPDPSDTHRVKLTEKERRLLQKFGLCFKCRAGKHWAKNCPETRPS